MERGWLCCSGQEEQRGAEEVRKRDTRIRTMGKWMADSKQAAPNGQTGFLAQGVRLEGTLELVMPGPFHETRKTLIARLLEVYALERDV